MKTEREINFAMKARKSLFFLFINFLKVQGIFFKENKKKQF